MSGLFGRARAQPENPFESDEEGPTTSSKMQNGSKAKGRSHSSGGGSSKNPFDDEEGFSHSKPPRYNSVGGEDDDDTPPKGRGANKENSRRGAAATSSQSDDLFGYNSSRAKSGFGNGQLDDNGSPDGEYVNQAVQDLEKHAVKKSQETTVSIKNCLRVADDTMGIGVQTLVTLHEQGVQIERTHERAVDLDQHLSKVCALEAGDVRRLYYGAVVCIVTRISTKHSPHNSKMTDLLFFISVHKRLKCVTLPYFTPSGTCLN